MAPTGTVRTSVLVRKISAYRNSFCASVKAKMPAEMKPGPHNGRTILTRVCRRVAPSIRAAPNSSIGPGPEKPICHQDEDGNRMVGEVTVNCLAGTASAHRRL